MNKLRCSTLPSLSCILAELIINNIMDKLVDDVTEIIFKNKVDIVSCNEISHFSKASLTFIYKLSISLLKNGIIKRFSTENLGVIDALLMNRWLDGQIDCTLDELCNTILPFSSTGTYNWLKYFKKSKYKVQIVGLEGDTKMNKDTYKYLKPILSNSFYTGLLNKVDKLLPLVKTKTDRRVYDSITNGKIWVFDPDNPNRKDRDMNARYTFWYKNIEKEIKKGSLFCDGFHLSKAKDELQYLQKKNIKLLAFAMASANKEFPCVKVDKKFYNEYNVTEKDIIDNPDLFWKKFTDYVFTLNMYEEENWRKMLCHINKYWEPTPLEKKYGNDYNVIKSTNIKNGYFVINGSFGFPVFPNQNSKYINNVKKSWGLYAKNYDYIIFVPKSLSLKNVSFEFSTYNRKL